MVEHATDPHQTTLCTDTRLCVIGHSRASLPRFYELSLIMRVPLALFCKRRSCW